MNIVQTQKKKPLKYRIDLIMQAKHYANVAETILETAGCVDNAKHKNL